MRSNDATTPREVNQKNPNRVGPKDGGCPVNASRIVAEASWVLWRDLTTRGGFQTHLCWPERSRTSWT